MILQVLGPYILPISSPFRNLFNDDEVISSTSHKNVAERNMKWFGDTIQQRN
jgi:hypothetical protein